MTTPTLPTLYERRKIAWLNALASRLLFCEANGYTGTAEAMVKLMREAQELC